MNDTHSAQESLSPPSKSRSHDASAKPVARHSAFGLMPIVAVVSALLGGAAVWSTVTPAGDSHLPNQSNDFAAPSDDDEPTSDAVTLPEVKWPVAGIRIETAQRSDIVASEWVTGTVALNEDRLAQIDPLVEGIVHDVKVQFGDDVTAGQTLAIIDSREVGQAKLELFRTRLATKLAVVDAEWQREIETNVLNLIGSLTEQIPIADIEARFTGKSMGTWREQLVSAYARLHKSRADFERLSKLSDQGISAGKDRIAARATFEADQALLQALLEQIRFTARQNRLTADQTLDQAQTAESISETSLRIMGLGDAAASATDPTTEGEAVSHYPIRAPFDGTIIEKDVVLKERVGPATQLFAIADLRTVWVTADIYERHMGTLAGLKGRTIRFRTAVYPDRLFEARVFSTGSIVNDQSRTLPMTALAANPEQLLKPGMFVEVELPDETVPDVLTVPATAVLDHAGQTFVFIHSREDQFERRDVAVGRSFNGRQEIIAGLNAGDSVVAVGGFFLKSQMLQGQFADDD
ncbi:efflux RND transporter periplasmic adaptor subunit [bacterium]|nr:efflux RND transporter periplasmic adaptor subunit [bacterium]